MNAKPYRCPICDGTREVDCTGKTDSAIRFKNCWACNATGVLWGPPDALATPIHDQQQPPPAPALPSLREVEEHLRHCSRNGVEIGTPAGDLDKAAAEVIAWLRNQMYPQLASYRTVFSGTFNDIHRALAALVRLEEAT